MAVKFLESFDRYASGTAINATWLPGTGWFNSNTGGSPMTVAAASASSRNGDTTAGVGQYMSTGGFFNWAAPWTADANDVTWILGYAINQALDSTSRELHSFYGDNGGTQHIRFFLNMNGSISVFRGSTQLGVSSAAIWPGGWNYLETLVTISDTVGVVTIKVNGTQVLNLTGQDTRNGGTNLFFDFIQWQSIGGPIDDVYLVNADTSGETTFLGDGRCEEHFPNGAGATTNWTRGGTDSGANWSQVDESPGYNGDTDYVKSSTLNDKDTYAFTDIYASNGTVKAVQVTVMGRKDTTENK